MRLSQICVLLLLLLSAVGVVAQPVKYSNEFLSIGVGARSLAMGNAQVATIGNVTSGYWNPAGLMHMNNDLQMTLMHAEYFAGIGKFDYGAVAVPIDDKNRALGFSLIRFGVDDIPNTLELVDATGNVNYDNIKAFSVADYAFLASYAQRLPLEGLTIGGSFKIIHRIAGSFATSWGFGLDAGLQYKRNNWRFGLMAKDVTTTYNAWSFSFTEREKEVLLSTGNELPENSVETTMPKFILGAAYEFNIKDKFKILPEVNFDVTTDGRRNVLISAKPFSIEPHGGLELSYSDIIFLRGGITNIEKSTDDLGENIRTFVPTIGAGLRIMNNVHIDYALSRMNNTIPIYTHVVSLMIGFNKKPQ